MQDTDSGRFSRKILFLLLLVASIWNSSFILEKKLKLIGKWISLVFFYLAEFWG